MSTSIPFSIFERLATKSSALNSLVLSGHVAEGPSETMESMIEAFELLLSSSPALKHVGIGDHRFTVEQIDRVLDITRQASVFEQLNSFSFTAPAEFSQE